MPSLLYKFDKLDPDQGDRGDSGAGFLINMNPISGIYTPGPSMQRIRAVTLNGGGALDGEVCGFHCHEEIGFLSLDDATTRISLYAGDIYGTIQTDDEYDVTPATGWTNNGTGGTHQFCSYGDRVFAAITGNKIVNINVVTFKSTPTTNFVFPTPTAGGYNPEARFITSHGGHLVAAGITFASSWNGLSGTNGSMVWWSGFDNPESFGSYAFTPNILGSDYKFLYDTPGDITAMASNGDYLFVFKQNSIYIAEGPPFRFSLLSPQFGTICPNSILVYNGWVYFMSGAGPARIKPSGEFEILTEGFTKATTNIDGGTADLNGTGVSSFFSTMLYPFSTNGFNSPANFAHRKVYTAISEQYGIVYFCYPSFFDAYPDPDDDALWKITSMSVMSYDIVTGNIGYSIPWANNQTGTVIIPWSEDGATSEGTRNMFAMRTLGSKPAKGKAKDVIVVGTSDAAHVAENAHVLSFYFLDPTIFYGRNISHYTRALIGTKIIRPREEKSVITKVRPIMRFGFNYQKANLFCHVLSFSKTSTSGTELYGHSGIAELGPYVAAPLNLVNVATSSLVTADGSIIIDTSVAADEHIIIFGIHTGSPNGSSTAADYITTTGIAGLEIFYESAGNVSR